MHAPNSASVLALVLTDHKMSFGKSCATTLYLLLLKTLVKAVSLLSTQTLPGPSLVCHTLSSTPLCVQLYLRLLMSCTLIFPLHTPVSGLTSPSTASGWSPSLLLSISSPVLWHNFQISPPPKKASWLTQPDNSFLGKFLNLSFPSLEMQAHLASGNLSICITRSHFLLENTSFWDQRSVAFICAG